MKVYTENALRRFAAKFFQFLMVIAIYGFFTAKPVCAQTNLNSSNDYIYIVKQFRYLNPDSALFYVKKGIAHAEASQDQLGKAALLNQYGMIEDNATNLEKSEEKYLAAEQIYRQQKNEKGLATVLIRLAGVERKKGNSTKALNYIMDALKRSEKIRDKAGILEARTALAQTYFFLNDLNRVLYNLRIAEEIDKQIPLSNMSMDMYIYFGSTYDKLKKPDSAISYIHKGLEKSDKPEYYGFRVTLLQELGIAYSLKGDMPRAIKALKKSLSLAVTIKNLPRQQTTLIEIANVYEKDQPDSALAYLEQAMVIATHLKKDRQRIVVFHKMSEIYEKKGDFKMALSLNEKSYKLSEEVYYKDMAKQISNLEAAYQLEKSNAQLSELKLKNNKEKTLRNIVASIAIAIALLFVITLIYFYKASHLNKLLGDANVKLAESNEEKDKFFSIIAHDIRSPMASTIGVLRLIADKELDEGTQVDVVNKLALHCESSLEILDKLLRWGQMQIKGTSINITQFKPTANVDENVALLKDAAEHKKIEITIGIPGEIVLKADSNHFDFVIRNLLANAIKFTPTGGKIMLSAEMQTASLACFSITDNGVGISRKRIENLFKLSSTGTKGTSAEEGTSLGLLVCKEFITANKGEMEVLSELGKGTTFKFTLPASTAILI